MIIMFQVYYAQKANFDGVIVFNNKDNKIYQMQGNGRKLNH